MICHSVYINIVLESCQAKNARKTQKGPRRGGQTYNFEGGFVHSLRKLVTPAQTQSYMTLVSAEGNRQILTPK